MDHWYRQHPQGSGAVAVFLPGLFAGQWIWREQIEPVYNLGFDVLSFPKAFIAANDRKVSVQSLIASCVEAIMEHEPNELILLGNSLGGLVALGVAEASGIHVSKMVLSGVPGVGPAINLGLEVQRTLTLDVAERIAEKVFLDRARVPKDVVRGLFDDVITARTLSQMSRILRSTRYYDAESLASRVVPKIPTTFVWGERDEVTPLAPWLQLIHSWPETNVVQIENSGHCPMIEKPDEFNKILLELLKPGAVMGDSQQPRNATAPITETARTL